jgi:hypothetical protein
MPDPERYLGDVLLLPMNAVPCTEHADPVRAAAPLHFDGLERELLRQHSLEICPPLRVVLALAPQDNDSDPLTQILNDDFGIALLLLVVTPQGLWNLTI